MLLRLLRFACQAAHRARGPSLVLIVIEREGPEAAQGSTNVLRMWMDPGVEDRPHLQVLGAGG